MGPSFFQTKMGAKFYESDIPRALRALERLVAVAEKVAEAYEEPEKFPSVTPESRSLEEIRTLTGRLQGESTVESVRRVLREKDALVAEVNRLTRRPSSKP